MNIQDLESKKLPDLREIAKAAGIKKVESFKKIKHREIIIPFQLVVTESHFGISAIVTYSTRLCFVSARIFWSSFYPSNRYSCR